ncbi:ChbG/HpnK family deacetylase [Salinarimonas sp.]|uniref:ChbG/HpnK family deacetylase n=1 Tax=Salinarimonas sp. TaxID=2766526 RepID=UPI00391C75EF
MTTEARPLLICADDYGLTDGICDAIIDLVSFARLSAIGVRAGGAVFAQRAGEIAALDRSVALGLVLDLAPLAGGRAAFAARALVGALDRDVLAAAIERDLDAFEARIGRPPDFLGSPSEDHVLPTIRGALFAVLERRRGRLPAPFLRDPTERIGAVLRRGVSRPAALARNALAAGFAARARRRGFAVNNGYAGYWRRNVPVPVPTLFERHVVGLAAGRRRAAPLLVCRPGYRDDALDRLDPDAQVRVEELMYLSSTRFTNLWEALRLVPTPHPVG